MKFYLAHFTSHESFNKIQLIKIIKCITQMDLRNSKNFVEDKLFDKTMFTLRLTESQLGRHLIYTTLQSQEGCNPSPYYIASIELEPERDCIDLTGI